ALCYQILELEICDRALLHRRTARLCEYKRGYGRRYRERARRQRSARIRIPSNAACPRNADRHCCSMRFLKRSLGDNCPVLTKQTRWPTQTRSSQLDSQQIIADDTGQLFPTNESVMGK
ncbi:unnamed protein product, partial [Ixodes pacificus]